MSNIEQGMTKAEFRLFKGRFRPMKEPIFWFSLKIWLYLLKLTTAYSTKLLLNRIVSFKTALLKKSSLCIPLNLFNKPMLTWLVITFQETKSLWRYWSTSTNLKFTILFFLKFSIGILHPRWKIQQPGGLITKGSTINGLGLVSISSSFS